MASQLVTAGQRSYFMDIFILFSHSHPPLQQSSAVDLKTKEEKDAELDRRIEALRKKNEALVKRYQVFFLF